MSHAGQAHSSTQMTAEEAAEITRRFDTGALDSNLPGTMDIVNEARRVETRDYMWGSPGSTLGGRSLRRLIGIGCGCIATTIGGLTLVFVTSR